MEEKITSRPAAKKGLGFPDWHFDNYEREVLLGFELSRRPASGAGGLLQNCDLPPPVKLFSPVEEDDKRSRISSANLSSSPSQQAPAPPPNPSKAKEWGEEDLGLLRALQLSQTRAREAERKAALASTGNDQMAALLLEESLRLSAHRHWVKLLEAEISLLQKNRSWLESGEAREDDSTPPAPAAAWCLTLALCLGIAGIGFALGYLHTWF